MMVVVVMTDDSEDDASKDPTSSQFLLLSPTHWALCNPPTLCVLPIPGPLPLLFSLVGMLLAQIPAGLPLTTFKCLHKCHLLVRTCLYILYNIMFPVTLLHLSSLFPTVLLTN